MRLSLPYENFESLQFNNDETMNFAYFNAHIRKLFANFDAYTNVQKLPIASTSNYGLVRIASVSDIQNETNVDSVLSLNNFQDFLRSGIETQRKSFTNDNVLTLNKNLSILTGTITVPTGFYIGKTVSTRPSHVLFAHVALEVPGMAYGDTAHSLFDRTIGETTVSGRRYTCMDANSESTIPSSEYIDVGKIRFNRSSDELSGVKHLQAYYKDGVVVVRNESFAENKNIGTSSIRVRWTIIQRNT